MSVQGPRGVNASCLKDTTAPPTPTVARAMAFDRATSAARDIGNAAVNVARPHRPDPAYFELHNVEVGSRIQIINLSKNPAARWEGGDVVELPLTGRDVQNRQASVYLSNEQMTALGVAAGDMLQLRAVDGAGNASAAVSTELMGTEWANTRIQDRINNTNVVTRGATVPMLDGEGTRKNVIAKAVNDTRPPLMAEDRLRLATWTDEAKTVAKTLVDGLAQWKGQVNRDWFGHDECVALAKNEALPAELRAAFQTLVDKPGMYKDFDQAAGHNGFDTAIGLNDLKAIMANQVTLQADLALEPGATVNVINQRTGERFPGTVGQDRGLAVHLANMKDGDPLHITPTDNNAVAGKTVELVYSSRCQDGKAPKLKNGIEARLPGVI